MVQTSEEVKAMTHTELKEACAKAGIEWKPGSRNKNVSKLRRQLTAAMTTKSNTSPKKRQLQGLTTITPPKRDMDTEPVDVDDDASDFELEPKRNLSKVRQSSNHRLSLE